MDTSAQASGGNGRRTAYILLGILAVLILLVLASLSKSPTSAETSTTSISSGTSVNSAQTSIPSTVAINITNQTAYSPTGTIYCVGGFNQSNITGYEGVARTYNTSVYAIADNYGPSFYNISSANFSWISNRTYPIDDEQLSCVADDNYAYCIGGDNHTSFYMDNAYSTALYRNGTSQWYRTTSYPISVFDPSCVASDNYVYCTGGDVVQSIAQNNSGDNGEGFNNIDVTADSYYAQVGRGSISQWYSTTSYPQLVFQKSCLTYNGYIYCVGGVTGVPDPDGDGSIVYISASNSTYYAPITQSGIGTWIRTTSYPLEVYGANCIQDDGYIYCIGGGNSTGVATNQTYYASLTKSGIGHWTRTSAYPLYGADPSDCVANMNVVYCIGAVNVSQGQILNSSYYATLSGSGIGQWGAFSNYTVPIESQSCISA